MKEMYRLIGAALAASDLFRDGDTPDDAEIRELVRAADDYMVIVATPKTHDHEDNCLMCAVRALTEGDPATNWVPAKPGDSVSGVVLRYGTLASDFDTKVPFVDLWTGGSTRIRVIAFPSSLRDVLGQLSAQVGDRLTVGYDGMREVETKFGPRQYKTFSGSVQRGH